MVILLGKWFKNTFNSMKIEIHNWEILKKYIPEITFSETKLLKTLQKHFSVYNILELGIIFVEDEYIHSLNKEYRKKDYVTDVLSFSITTEPLIGEVYIAPCYVSKNTPKDELVENILRNIIHGVLHIVGYDHKEYFTEETEKKEKMFVKQEGILKEIYEYLD